MEIRWSIDTIRSHRISGWIFHPGAADKYVEVTVSLDGMVIGKQIAAKYRPDLRLAGIGDGDHAFDVYLALVIAPKELSRLTISALGIDGQQHGLQFQQSKWQDDPSAPKGGALDLDSVGFTDFDFRRLKRMIRLGGSYSLSLPIEPPCVSACDVLPPESAATDAALVEVAQQCGIPPTQVAMALQRDTWPLPTPSNRENYAPGADHVYWLSGFLDHYRLRKLAEANDLSGGRCLDFGGSSGRVARHFAIQCKEWDVWLADFKETSVDFVNEYLPNSMRAFSNSALPTLPIQDGYFDFIFSCSVFTHINETEVPWLLELRRVLRVGGIACISIHNDDTWRALRSEGAAARKVLVEWAPAFADLEEIPPGKRLVVSYADDDPYGCNAYHSDAYVRRVWGRFFEIVEIVPLHLGQQAYVVCRRTN
jgi:ubiquinone/menaquinone biosynthesis C-methylase UbiE